MYEAYFGLKLTPFSIAPDPRFLYMSKGHREAMAHLLYGIREGGGFVQLTGEVGTGKTTLCRGLLAQLPDNVDTALIINPKVDEAELLESVCDELRIAYAPGASVKDMVGLLNTHLLKSHAKGRRTLLIIDESQNLSGDVLEHVRLLTNLETERSKLLQIILIGQTELKEKLETRALRQLAQRITARYHLDPLSLSDTREYVRHRLEIAGAEQGLFSEMALRRVHRLSGGVPRLINVICDRALLGAYAGEKKKVTRAIVSEAGREVTGEAARKPWRWSVAIPGLLLLAVALTFAAHRSGWYPNPVGGKMEKIVESIIGEGPLFGVDSSATVVVPALASTGEVSLDLTPTINIPASRQTGIVMLSPALIQRMFSSGRGVWSRVDVLRRLVAVWGQDSTLVLDCVSVAEVGLRCLQGEADWDALMDYDRPFAIELDYPGTGSQWVLVRRMNDIIVEVDTGDRRIPLAIEETGKYWNGKYLLLWRPPPLLSLRIDRSSNPEDVRWLRRALNLASVMDGDLPISDVESGEFDEELLDRLSRFQERYRLPVENSASEVVLIMLATRLGLASHLSLGG